MITDKNKYDDGKEKEEEKRVRKGQNTERYGGMQDMTTYKLGEVESRFADMIWEREPLTMRELVELCEKELHWKRTTTYTVLKKCVEKQAVLRTEPGFVCSPLISRAEVQADETNDLIDRMYGGSKDLLIASLLGNQEMTPDDLARLKKLVEEMK